MIEIKISDPAYVNDIYPLVKAFYPKDNVHIINDGVTGESGKTQNMDMIHESDRNKTYVFIEFEEDEITLIVRNTNLHTQKTCVANKELLTKAQYKNEIKKSLYELLKQQTKRDLPWGILTGIRPTKLVYELLDQGVSESKVFEHMRQEYNCSDAKIGMSIEIAKKELLLLKQMEYTQGYSLYIGIPFCPSTCLYCSFTSYSVQKYSHLVEDYLQALEKELQYAATCFPDKILTTVYLGGGTPTTLTANQLDGLLFSIKQKFEFTHVKEFCVEAGRPDSITEEKLKVLKKYGVDRISINPQSMQQKTLDVIGRNHSVNQLKEAFYLARKVGHDNINMDIIIGLPTETPEDVKNTLSQIKELNPESLTVHTLALKRAARLNLNKEEYEDKEAVQVSDMMEEALHYAKENQYRPYYLYRQKNMSDNLENIGFSKAGKEGLYNILIMEEKQTILALGAGAMSKFVFHKENRLERVDNVKSVTDYITRIDEMIKRKQDFINQNPEL